MLEIEAGSPIRRRIHSPCSSRTCDADQQEQRGDAEHARGDQLVVERQPTCSRRAGQARATTIALSGRRCPKTAYEANIDGRPDEQAEHQQVVAVLARVRQVPDREVDDRGAADAAVACYRSPSLAAAGAVAEQRRRRRRAARRARRRAPRRGRSSSGPSPTFAPMNPTSMPSERHRHQEVGQAALAEDEAGVVDRPGTVAHRTATRATVSQPSDGRERDAGGLIGPGSRPSGRPGVTT